MAYPKISGVTLVSNFVKARCIAVRVKPIDQRLWFKFIRCPYVIGKSWGDVTNVRNQTHWVKCRVTATWKGNGLHILVRCCPLRKSCKFHFQYLNSRDSTILVFCVRPEASECLLYVILVSRLTQSRAKNREILVYYRVCWLRPNTKCWNHGITLIYKSFKWQRLWDSL